MNNAIDLVIIATYLALIVSLGVWVGVRGRRGSHDSARNYFLASGKLRWPVIGLALFSTNISTIHLVAFAQEGFVNGLAYGNFEWMAAFTLIILSLFFVPFYIRAKVTTLPDFLEKRYNGTCRDMLAVISVFSAVFIHIGFSLYTGGIVLNGMFGIPLPISIIAICGLVGLYTVLGGLSSVVITEAIETVVLLVGAVIITVICFVKLGGWQELVDHVEPVKLTIIRPHGDSSGLPWYAVLLGYPVIGIWYWCADQTIVQRVLGAKDENHARIGPLFAGFVKILPVLLFVLPGLMCYALVQNGTLDIAGMAVGDDGKPDTQDTYAFMIRELLPTGVKGVITAALLAALMGTVAGALNSVSTLVSYDLVKRWRPATDERTLVRVGRMTALFTVVLAVVWSLQLGRYESIFQGVSALICYVAPPITAVFLWGVFWKRASGTAAAVTLSLGSALGFTVFLLDWFKESTGWNVPFLMAAFYLFVICSVILAVVSLIVPHRHTQESAKLVWANPLEAVSTPGWPGLADYRVIAALLFVTMLALYWFFR
ncbi:sodium:solute symporter [Haloferula sp. A504]|uniref:sodium:solute symporter n=1 Tax=Haloferula sp. A504 TaxID=3373601 RepID=UPI0031CA8D29|nr:sodium:solute symporter [Verrucomicrobiaceae bacterium E54]